MAQIGNIPEIIEVKELLERMKKEGLVSEWELPYENLLTRLSAAIFFLTPVSEESMPVISENLGQFKDFAYMPNTKKKLSQLVYRIEFKANQDLQSNPS